MKAFAVELDSLLTVAAAVLDPEGVLLESNAGFRRLIPSDPKQPVGASITRFFVQPTFSFLLAAAGTNDGGEYRGLLTIGDPLGVLRTLRGRVWRCGEQIRVLAEYDIAELEKLNDVVLSLNREVAASHHALARANVTLKQREVESVEASLTDPLTGVGNRRKLDQALVAEISRVARLGGTLSVIMADLDHFKQINDTFGHGAGDSVLVHIGGLLRANTRPTDTVARFGGEEFVVLLPNTDLAQALAKADQLRHLIEARVIAPLSAPATSSFGVAELSDDEDGVAFLGRADAALYQAKEAGRNTVIAASPRPSAAPRLPDSPASTHPA